MKINLDTTTEDSTKNIPQHYLTTEYQESLNGIRDNYAAEQEKQREAARLADRPWYEKAYDYVSGKADFQYCENIDATSDNTINALAGFNVQDSVDEYNETNNGFLKRANNASYVLADIFNSGAKSAREGIEDAIENPNKYAPFNNLAKDELGKGVSLAFPDGSGATELYNKEMDKYVRPTDAYKLWSYNKEEVLNEAKGISERLSKAFGKEITAEQILYSKDSLSNSRAMDEVCRKRMEVTGDDNPENLTGYMIERFPAMKDMSSVDAAITLNNAKDAKAVSGIFNNLIAGKEAYNIQSEMADIYNKEAIDGEKLTESDRDRLNYLRKQLQSIKEAVPSITNSPFSYIVNQTVEQLGGMASDIIAGQAVAGITGAGAGAWAAAKGAGVSGSWQAAKKGYAAAQGVAKVVTAASMFKRQYGPKYFEYRYELKDVDGNLLMATDEARAMAAIETGIETGIEFWNYDEIMGLFPKGAKAQIAAIVAKNKGNKEAIMAEMKTISGKKMADFALANYHEMVEEGWQDATDKVVHNFIVDKYKTNNNEKSYSNMDIAEGAADAMVQAAPSILGMTIAGAGLSKVTSRVIRGQQLKAQLSDEQVQNVVTGNMLRDLKENQKENELYKKSPDVYAQVVKYEAEQAGMGNVYIDAEMLLQEEGGEQVLKQVADKLGLNEEQVKELIDKQGDIEVPTDVYSQTVLPSEMADRVIDFTTSNPEIDCSARTKARIEQMKANYKAITEAAIKDQQEVIDNVVQNNFTDKHEQELATLVLSQYPNNPKNGITKVTGMMSAERDAILAPALDVIEKTSGQGVANVKDEDTGRYIRVSNNSQWYGKWYAEHKRQLTKQDKLDLAYDLMTGTNTYGVEGLGYEEMQRANSAEAAAEFQKGFDENKDKLDKIDNDLQAMARIKEKMSKDTFIDTAISKGLTPEGYKAYKKIEAAIDNSPLPEVQKTSKFAAVLLARHAQNMVKLGMYPSVDAYMNSIDINANANGTANVAAAAQYSQSMYDVRKAGTKSVVELLKRIHERKAKGLPENKLMFSSNAGVMFSEEQLVHAVKTHNLSIEDLADIEDNIGIISNAAISSWKDGEYKGVFNGTTVIGRIDGNKASYFVALEFSPNGSAWFKTAAKNNVDAINKKIEEGNAGMLSLSDDNAVSASQASSISISSIREKLGVVNGKEYKKIEDALINNSKTDLSSAGQSGNQASSVTESVPQKAGVFNQNIGGRAVSQFGSAKLQRAYLDAQSMEMAGKSYAEIEKATGWFKLPDGQWRYEIPDNLDKIDFKAEQEKQEANANAYAKEEKDADDTYAKLQKRYDGLSNKRTEEAKELYKKVAEAFLKLKGIIDKRSEMLSASIELPLSQIYDNEALYELYPDLRNLPVVLKADDSTTGGYITNKADAIYINPMANKSFDHKETLLHELQHIIQHREGFARGGNSEAGVNLWTQKLKQQYNAISDKREKIPFTHGISILVNLYDIKQRMTIGAGVDISDASKFSHVKGVNELFKKFDHEFNMINIAYQNAFDARNRKEIDRLETASNELKKKYSTALRTVINDRVKELEVEKLHFLENTDSKAIKGVEDYERYTKEMEAILKSTITNFEAYQNLHGEIEARDTARRGKEKVAKSKSNKTADRLQLYKNAIVSFNGKEVANVDTNIASYNQAAWHGTPHVFDSFDLDAIGTGEGNQAHGWGLYSAAQKSTAMKYRSNLTPGSLDSASRITYNGKTIDEAPAEVQLALIAFVSYNNKPLAAEQVQEVYDDSLTAIKDELENMEAKNRDTSKLRELLSAMKKLDAGKIRYVDSGALYEVDIPENDVLLDEQKPFNEQPKKVQDVWFNYVYSGWIKYHPEILKWAKEEQENDKKSFLLNLGDAKGEVFYSRLASDLGSPKAASLALNEAGIKGITYDGQQDGRCFVIFDDKAISIINRYNQAAMRKDEATSLADFYKNVTGSKVAPSEKGKTYYGFKTINANTIDVAHDDIKHFGRKHKLTEKEFSAIEASVENIVGAFVDSKKKGDYGGTPVLTKIKTPLGNAGVVFEMLPNGRTFMKTAFFDTYANIDNWMKKEGANTSLLDESKSSNFVSHPSISSIKEKLGIVNKYHEEQGPAVRGQIAISDTGKRGISLFTELANGKYANANESTFVHEMGHLFLDDLRRAAESGKANEQVLADWETTKQWLGWTEGQEKLTVEQHEKFADAFVAYLKTGEAPAVALEKPFKRFRTWLTNLYKDFVQLGGKPSKEISAVMDRMIATDEEIDLAIKQRQIDGFSKSVGFDVLDANTQKKLLSWQDKLHEEAVQKVMKQVMADIQNKQTEDLAQFRDSIKEGVEDDLSQEPIFRAENALQLSNNDYSILEVLGYTKESYEKEITARGGSFEKAVENEVNAKMKDIEADNLSQDAIAEMAKKAVQGAEYRQMINALELNALSKLGETMTREELAKVKGNIRVLRDEAKGTLGEYKARAEDALTRMPISTAMNTTMWTRKEAQAANACLKAMAAGKWGEAVHAKRNQLMYSSLAVASSKVKKQVDKMNDRITKQNAVLDKGTQRMPASERYYFQHISYILGLRRGDVTMPATLEDIQTMANKYKVVPDVETEEGITDSREEDIVVPENVVLAAKATKPTKELSYAKLSIADVKEITDFMQFIYHQGKNTDALNGIKPEMNGKQIGLQDTVTQLLGSIATNIMPETKNDYTGLNQEGQIKKTSKWLGKVFAVDLIAPATILQRIDGYIGAKGTQAVGIATRWLYDSVNKANSRGLQMDADVTKSLTDIFGVYTNGELNDIRSKAAYSFGSSKITKEQIMCLALNYGTEKNKQRIVNGFVLLSNEGEMSLEKARIAKEQIINELFSNLNERDWGVVQSVWQLFESYYAEQSAVEERTTGIPLGKEAAVPFSILGKDGNIYQLPGGYYPIVYDSSKSVAAKNYADTDVTKTQMPNNARLGVGRGSTKQRVKEVHGRPTLLTFDVMTRKLEETTHNIAFREVVRDVNRIINDNRFQAAMVDAVGMEAYRSLQNWALDIWQPQREKNSIANIIAAALRKRQTVAILGFRASTALMNLANTSLLIGHMGTPGFLKAYGDYLSNFASNTRFIRQMSPFMADRSETMDRDLKAAVDAKTKIGRTKRGIDEAAFWLISMTDNMFSYPLWLSEYKKVLNEGLQQGWNDVKIKEEAVAAADRAVVRLIGSGEVKDLSPLQKGGELSKQLTMFYTYFAAIYNLMANKYFASQQKWRKGERLSSLMPMLHGYLFYCMGTALIETGLRSMIATDNGGDDDKNFVGEYAKNLVGNTAGMIPVVRDIVRFGMDYATGGTLAKSKGPKYSSAGDVVVRLFDLCYQANKYLKYEGDKQEAIAKQQEKGNRLQRDKYGKVIPPKLNINNNVDGVDVARAAGKFFNSVAGTPDMITDSITSTARFAANDYENETKEFVLKTLFDRKLEKLRDREGNKLPSKKEKEEAKAEREAMKNSKQKR